MSKIIIFLILLNLTFAQSIRGYLTSYIKEYNKAVKNDLEKLNVLEINDKHNWAKVSAGENTKYFFLWNINGQDYLVESECICPNICEPPDFIFYKAGKYSSVASPTDFSLAKETAKKKLSVDYKLYFIPALYSNTIYVFAYTGNNELDILDDEFSESSKEETELLSDCVYKNKKFEIPDDDDMIFIGYYKLSNGKLLFYENK